MLLLIWSFVVCIHTYYIQGKKISGEATVTADLFPLRLYDFSLASQRTTDITSHTYTQVFRRYKVSQNIGRIPEVPQI